MLIIIIIIISIISYSIISCQPSTMYPPSSKKTCSSKHHTTTIIHSRKLTNRRVYTPNFGVDFPASYDSTSAPFSATPTKDQLTSPQGMRRLTRFLQIAQKLHGQELPTGVGTRGNGGTCGLGLYNPET